MFGHLGLNNFQRGEGMEEIGRLVDIRCVIDGGDEFGLEGVLSAWAYEHQGESLAWGVREAEEFYVLWCGCVVSFDRDANVFTVDLLWAGPIDLDHPGPGFRQPGGMAPPPQRGG